MKVDYERWLLPEGIEELLPPRAARLEQLRRRLLDLFARWGYELVNPPLVDYLDSLLTGTGNDLGLQTFQFTDLMSGRQLGVRADITPQVSRIDAHRLSGREGPVRLCYEGTVLHTRGDGLGGSRSFSQIGAELYGHAGVESDAEMLCLMLEMLDAAEVGEVYVDLGHVGIFRALTQAAKLSQEQEAWLFDALQRKAAPEIDAMLAQWDLSESARRHFAELVWLNGDADVLAQARDRLAAGNEAIAAALVQLMQVAQRVTRRRPAMQLHFDLAELRGYHYHTGLVFAAYQPGQGRAIAQGGRYDDIGQVFGRARPATGFSADLRALMALSRMEAPAAGGVFAPAVDDAELQKKLEALRAAGQRVVCALPGQKGGAVESGCDQELVMANGKWIVQPTSEQ
jgi:ATP phosphoribosyltransferase regulatory subunit